MRLPGRAGIALVVLVRAGAAHAAGGAHVIDDAAVETPGTCHLETWGSGFGHSAALLSASPACTRRTWPNLEIGGFVAHARSRGADDTSVGITPKLVFRSEDRGVGIGVATSLGFGIDRSRLEITSVIVPVTVPVGKSLRLNFNAGWQWLRAGREHDLFIGAQAEIAVATNLGAMVEGFTRDRGKAGGQAGLRWTIGGGAIDLDLLAGRYLDGVAARAFTLGLTVRR